MANKTYSELVTDLEIASIALRYCMIATERPALTQAKLSAESAIEAYNDAEAEQDLVNGD